MPRSLNRTMLIGNLGKDPELRYTANNTAVATFNIATSESWTDKEGAKQEQTEWHRIVAWGRLAEICGQYMTKGKQVYVEGRLQTRQWDDQNGIKRYTTEVVAREILLLGGGGEKGSGSYGPPPPEDPPAYLREGSSSNSTEEDIPF